jgi:plastocyanin
MRRYLFASSALVGFSTTWLLVSQLPAPAAEEAKTIEIVKNADGKFVFSDTNAKINTGQTINWVAKDADVPHQLVPDTPEDAMKETLTFDSTSGPSQKFDTAGTIHYHCAIHPKSMKGTITVAAAAEAPAKEEAPKEKAPPKAKPNPSNDSGY